MWLLENVWNVRFNWWFFLFNLNLDIVRFFSFVFGLEKFIIYGNIG